MDFTNLTGGLYHNLSSDSPEINNGAFTGSIRFVVTVNTRQESEDTSTADYAILNSVNGTARNLNSNDPNNVVTDGSSTVLYFPRLTLDKDVYAINNDTNVLNNVTVSPGDNVTFILTFTVYGGTISFINLTDLLPSCLFSNVMELIDKLNQPTGMIPTSGNWAYLTDERLYDSIVL